MVSDQSIVLKSGRKLAFNEYGDHKGFPVFYFHGWPASRLSGAETDLAAKKLGIRVISPDRPGFGLSDFQPGRALLDWPKDVVELADHLHLKQFSLLGVSGGGPYAAACAFALPYRVTHAAIVVGLAPVNVPGITAGMFAPYAWAWRHYHAYPAIRIFSSAFFMLTCKYLPALNRLTLFNAKEDRAKLRHKSFDSTNEAYRQGIKAAAQELQIFTDAWGFSLSHIKLPVDLWYAAADKNVSLKMGEYYRDQIPGSVLHLFPSGGHLSRTDHEEKILSGLIC